MMKRKNNGFIPLLFVTIVLCFGFITLYHNQSDFLKTVDENYKSKRSVNLEKGLPATVLSDFLVNQDYVPNS